MGPATKGNVSNGRRQTLNNAFKRSLSLTQINTDVANGTDGEKKDKRRLGKRASLFGVGPSASPDQGDGAESPNGEGANSPKMTRPKTLQKGRPASIFGSLGRKSFTSIDEGNEVDTENAISGSPELHMEDAQLHHAVLYHGEIQTTSGMFRKKKEYLVLTDTHLIRFKGQTRAAETFPSIPSTIGGRSATTRHPSSTSVGSLPDVQSINSHASLESENRVPLAQVVSVYKVEDGRPFFTTEVVFLDEEYHGVGTIQLMLHDPKEADLWHTSIRGAAEKARLLMEVPYPDRVIEYLVSAVEAVDDYDTQHFQVFRVVRRTTAAKGKSSSDDLQKLGSSVCYMVIGINRLHLIPVPDYSASPGRLRLPKGSRSTHGIVSLVDIKFSYEDDRFEIAFRKPLQPAEVLELAASATPDIVVSILRSWQFLKPLWEDHNFNFSGPRRLMLVEDIIIPPEEDLACFERSLVAYCMAYGCNPMNIQYAVDWDAEDAPEFILYPPQFNKKYGTVELLAVMRALRYNETFRSISFKDIDLHALHSAKDIHGSENAALATRSGIQLQKYFNLQPISKSALYQEIQALALKSGRLRRMDFTNCLPRRRPRDNFDPEGSEVSQDPGCEIVAALLPLCQYQLTNITYIVLNGIELGETDLDYLIPGLSRKQSNIRAIECARCGLTDRGIMQLITHLERQSATVERINISGNPGRIHLEQFQESMSRFTNIRSLDLSRTSWTSGDEPLVRPEVLLTWQLEELILNGIVLNEKTLHSISAYLVSHMSNELRTLQMDQCNLSGEHVALLMRSMSREGQGARDLDFNVSANRLERGVGEIVKAIETNHTPTRLFLQMIEFTKEDHFRQLLQALRTNTSIRTLDISKASLPYDAGKETCECLRRVFAENETLEEFDISGEQAHLEVTRFGIGLNHALTGLRKNKTLKILRIEYQNLGLEGANTLASVIEANNALTHIFCEHNDINLQGFTILVNALAKNTTILDLPFMQDDQTTSMRRMNANMRDSRRAAVAVKNDHAVKQTVRRTLHSFGVVKPAKPDLTPQDIDAAGRVLKEMWEHEMTRLAMFLERNNNFAMGMFEGGMDGEMDIEPDNMRPTSVLSEGGIMQQALSDTTPRVESSNPLDEYTARKFGGLNMSDATTAVNTPISRERGISNGTVKGYVVEKNSKTPLQLPELKGFGKEKLFENESEKGVFMMES